MKWFLIVQTALNFLAAVTGKEPSSRFLCLAFGIWGGYFLANQFWN